MLRLILFLVIAAVLATAAVWLANSPGQVAITWGATETVLPVGIGVAIMAAITAAGIVLYELYRWVVGLPRRIRDHRQHKRQIKGYQELTHGLIAAAAGDVSGARVHTRQAEKLLDANAATLLLSAQTAQLEGKEDVAQLKFQQMLKKPQTEFLGVRGLLADAVKRGDQAEALELARRAYQRSPSTSWVLTTYFDLLTRAGKWAEALELLTDMAREKLLTPAEATRRRALMKHMLADDALKAGNPRDALAHARKATSLAPGFTPAAVTAANAARELGRIRKARRLLEDCWKLEPHPELARAYADLVPEESAADRLRRCKRLETLRPDHLVAQMMMAELAMNARQWDTARGHLERMLRHNPTAGAYRLYAEYERASGGGDAKARDWLAKAADAPADKCWVCEDTGEVLADWQLFGPAGRFDSVHWDNPPTVAAMLREQRPPVVLVQDQSGQSRPAGAEAQRAAATGEKSPGPETASPATKSAAGGDGKDTAKPLNGQGGKANGGQADGGEAEKPAAAAATKSGGINQGLKAPPPMETTVKTPDKRP